MSGTRVGVGEGVEADGDIYCVRWLPDVRTIYSQGSRRKLVPASFSEELPSFYDCAAVLMSCQLQELLLDSMSDLTQMISFIGVGKGRSGLQYGPHGGMNE